MTNENNTQTGQTQGFFVDYAMLPYTHKRWITATLIVVEGQAQVKYGKHIYKAENKNGAWFLTGLIQ